MTGADNMCTLTRVRSIWFYGGCLLGTILMIIAYKDYIRRKKASSSFYKHMDKSEFTYSIIMTVFLIQKYLDGHDYGLVLGGFLPLALSFFLNSLRVNVIDDKSIIYDCTAIDWNQIVDYSLQDTKDLESKMDKKAIHEMVIVSKRKHFKILGELKKSKVKYYKDEHDFIDFIMKQHLNRV